MDAKQDVFGQMLLDAFMGIEIPEITERSDHYIISSLPVSRYFHKYAAFPLIHKHALRYARGKVLDVGCGAGRHSLYLQQKGLDVTGLDISPRAIDLCKLQGLKQTALMSISQISPKIGTFDTILLIENNFSLLENYNKAKRILKKMYACTSPKGRIIAQSKDPYNTTDKEYAEYQQNNLAHGRMAGQMRIRLRYKTMISPWFDYLMVSKQEMKDIVQGTGWKITEFLETDGRSYVAIIEKDL